MHVIKFASPATAAISVHWDHHDEGEYGVTINGEHHSDLSAFGEAEEHDGSFGSLIELAANLAYCGNQGSLSEAQVKAAAAACGFRFTTI